MQQGLFYFIKDEFFSKFDKEKKLMQNKDGKENRPCFYAFADNKQPSIYWLIPISHQVSKYKKIVENKLSKQRAKGIENPKCNTIRFGYVLGQERTFLIQNMFPITDKYILSIYLDKNSNKPVSITPETEKEIIANAKDVYKLVLRGYNYLVFADIKNIYKQLEKEILEDRYVNNLKQEFSKGINEEYKEYCKQITLEAKLDDTNLSSEKKEELIKIVEEAKNNKKTELLNIYTTAIKQEVSMYHEVNADNVIYFDQRDEAIFEQVKAFYDSQPQSKIDKILENINSLPKGLNPEGKLDILRNNGIKHSSEMEPEERKAAFEKEEVITPKFGGKDI